jgi:GTP-binding protein HflX
MKPQPVSTLRLPEQVVLIAVVKKGESVHTVEDHLQELAFLVHTAGGIARKEFIQKLEHPDPRTYVGKGKLAEILAYVKGNGINLAVFDDELSPSQIRNLEKELNIRIIDRTNLILDIFARRARTAQARVQVELAQYQYLMPRLTRMWTHLEKQQGGIGTRGPGEKEIETDRRVIRKRIAKLKEELQTISRQAAVQRKKRSELVRVALVGYTNAGKSTLMNALSHARLFAEDKLFATLDTTVRKVVWNNRTFLLSDTVGFIRKLPHQLVESFRSTLEEVREADLLLHVVDVSHPRFEEQISVVNTTLAEIGAGNKPVILVLNKTDLLLKRMKENGEEPASLEALEKSWMSRLGKPLVFISALTGMNVEELKNRLHQHVSALYAMRYPENTQPSLS